MDKQPVVWERQPHTAAKHLILRGYLGAWFPKLAWTGRVFFIDGFAGPGEYSQGEPGSPLIALEAALNHKGNLSSCELLFMFVERNEERYKHLDRLLQGIQPPANIKFQAVQGEFADRLGGILDWLDAEGKRLAPSFVMVDPFGFTGMPFELIARTAKHARSEFLISFMYESIVRWRNHKDHQATFDRLFGCPDWRRADDLQDAGERKRFLIELYVNQLRGTGLEYVRTFEMRDEGNRTEYFLVFASHSLDGLRAMKAAMWKADPSGTFRFSDATVSGQMTLIQMTPDFDFLKRLLVERFRGIEVKIEDVEQFVLVDTPFRETHYKRQILAPMERRGDLEVIRSPRRKRFTYPDRTVIKLG